MTEFYVPTSAGIGAGDELWAHHINKNGRIVLSKQTNPDDGHVSNTSWGRSGTYLGGDRLEDIGGDFVVAQKSTGFNRPGSIVGRCTGPVVVALPKASGQDNAPYVPEMTAKGDFFSPPPRDMKYNPTTQEWYRQKDDEED